MFRTSAAQASNEIVHPGILTRPAVFLRVRIEAVAVPRFIIQDLKPALWQNVLWQRHEGFRSREPTDYWG
jgi:hypothetical protein